MAMSFTELTAGRTTEGSIKNWVNNPNVPSAAVLTDAENDIYLRIRVREMRTTATITLSDGVEYASLPTGFLDPRGMKNKYKQDILQVDWDALENARKVDTTYTLIESEPQFFALFNDRIEFDCKADGDQNFTLLYMKQPDALAASTNETNFLTTKYSMLLRFACCKHASIFLKDSAGEQRYEARMMELIQRININDDLSYMGAVLPER